MGMHVELFWKNRRYAKTIPLTSSNLAIMWSVPGVRKYQTYTAAFPSRVVEIDQDYEPTVQAPVEDITVEQAEPFNFGDIVINKPVTSASMLQQELLHMHYRLGHISLDKLKNMARKGFIP